MRQMMRSLSRRQVRARRACAFRLRHSIGRLSTSARRLAGRARRTGMGRRVDDDDSRLSAADRICRLFLYHYKYQIPALSSFAAPTIFRRDEACCC